MAYKVGSISRIVILINMLMCLTSGAAVYYFINRDFLAAWVFTTGTLIILTGVPEYIRRLIINSTQIIKAYNQNLEIETINLPGFANELLDLNSELDYLRARTKETRSHNALSTLLMNSIIEHLPFALLVYDENEYVCFCNKECKSILGGEIEYLSATSHENKAIVTSLKQNANIDQYIYTENTNSSSKEYLISKTIFIIDNARYHLVSMKNIKTELDTNEIISWQKLIRVLNHEIMNSLTPISSLSEHLLTLFDNAPDFKQADIIKSSLALISRRSLSLMEFVKKYRQLAVDDKPRLEPFRLDELVQDTLPVFEKELAEAAVKFSFDAQLLSKDNLLDKVMFQQVLINLIKNSLESMQETHNPCLKISIREIDGQTHLSIIDNGSGISDEALPNIFIPFYTTKSTGSGIGLAISKQIIRLHNGSISVQSKPDWETVFTIILPQV
jgi:nitrogen fixation/metabolism regulation signal transduction histidine kinase